MRKAILVLLFVGLSACSSIQQQPANTDNSGYWHAKGRFTYVSDEIKESGNFDWRQTDEGYQLRLYGPLGMGTVRISGNTHLIRIRTGDQDISSDQPLSMLYQITGLKIPLNSLPDWLFGKPSSLAATNQTMNTQGQLSGFSESSWQISLSEYRQFGFSNQPLPGELMALGEGHQLRLLIRSIEAL